MSADPLDIDQELQICEAATPAPWWRTDPPWGDGTSVHAGPSDDPHVATKIVCQFDAFDVQFDPRYDDVDSADIVEFDSVTDDMAFIAHARTGYPLALRRIQELEKQLAAARAERDELRRVLNTCDDVIKQASHEMYWLDQQRKFTKGGSCDKARIGLKWAKMAIDNLKPPLTPDTEATDGQEM